MQGMAKGVKATEEMQARADASLASLAAYYGENASAEGSLGDFLGPVTAFAKELTAVQNGIFKQRKASFVIGPHVHPSLHTHLGHCFLYRRVMSKHWLAMHILCDGPEKPPSSCSNFAHQLVLAFSSSDSNGQEHDPGSTSTTTYHLQISAHVSVGAGGEGGTPSAESCCSCSQARLRSCSSSPVSAA